MANPAADAAGLVLLRWCLPTLPFGLGVLPLLRSKGSPVQWRVFLIAFTFDGVVAVCWLGGLGREGVDEQHGAITGTTVITVGGVGVISAVAGRVSTSSGCSCPSPW